MLIPNISGTLPEVGDDGNKIDGRISAIEAAYANHVAGFRKPGEGRLSTRIALRVFDGS